MRSYTARLDVAGDKVADCGLLQTVNPGVVAADGQSRLSLARIALGSEGREERCGRWSGWISYNFITTDTAWQSERFYFHFQCNSPLSRECLKRKFIFAGNILS